MGNWLKEGIFLFFLDTTHAKGPEIYCREFNSSYAAIQNEGINLHSQIFSSDSSIGNKLD